MSQKEIDHAIRTTFRNPPILASEDRVRARPRGSQIGSGAPSGLQGRERLLVLSRNHFSVGTVGDKMAADIGADRSMIIRLMVEHVLGHGSPSRSLLITGLIGRKGRRDTVAGRIASAVVENLKDRAKAYLAARRGAKTKARRDNEETPSRRPLPRT
jgi:hypothetical protein